MSAIEDAARKLALAEAKRKVAAQEAQWAQAAAETAYKNMQWEERNVDDALRELVGLTAEPEPAATERIVKRPATQASDLLDLDDNGGH